MARYPVEFPDEIFEFWDFARANTELLADLGVHTDGPFALLDGKPLDGDWPRFYRDPPEFFTVMTGDTDGLHWGYWFDAPGEQPPVVASYHHADAFQLSATRSLFEAVRNELEGHWVSAEDNKLDDPDEADHYDRQLERYTRLREELSRYALREREEVGEVYRNRYVFTSEKALPRYPVAKTRNGMGIVASAAQYEALPGKDRFVEQYDFKPSADDVAKMVAFAEEAAATGRPATALKLGHDLWPYAEHAERSYSMLRLGYAGLQRPRTRACARRGGRLSRPL